MSSHSIPENDTLNTAQNGALAQFRKGRAIIPTKQGAKQQSWRVRHVYDTEQQIINTFGLDKNVALLLGSISNNLADFDLDTPQAATVADVYGLETEIYGRKGKPRSHRLIVTTDKPVVSRQYKDPLAINTSDTAMLLELRGEWKTGKGALSQAPGSIHPSNETYEYDNECEPITMTRDAAYALAARMAVATFFAKHWPTGNRNNTAMYLAAWLRKQKWEQSDVTTFLRAIYVASGDDNEWRGYEIIIENAFTKDEDGLKGVEGIKDDWGRNVVKWISEKLGFGKEPQVPTIVADTAGQNEIPQYTNRWNAMLFRNKYGDDVRYVPQWKAWVIWNGKYWQRDEMLKITELADTVRDDIINVAKAATGREMHEAWTWVKLSSAPNAVNKMVDEAAKVYSSMKVPHDDLDTKHNLVVCNNGTLDLETGELLPFRKEDLLTRHVEYDYKPFNPDAPLALLASMAEESIANPATLRQLQKGMALSASGNTDKLFFVCYGPTDTGKTTLLTQGLAHLLGDYGRQMSLDSIVAGKNDQRAMWLADLHGARFALASEPSRGFELDVATIKSLSGDTTQKARALYEMPTQSKPTYTIFIDTNYRPKTPNGVEDDAFWNRAKLIHFKNKVKRKPGDDGYIANFKEVIQSKEQMELLLSWIVEGYRLYREEGINESDEMKEDKEEYRAEENPYGEFIDAHLTLCPDDKAAMVSINEVRTLYRTWARAMFGYKFVEPDWGEFNTALERRGFERDTKWYEGKTQKVWKYTRVTDGFPAGEVKHEEEFKPYTG